RTSARITRTVSGPVARASAANSAKTDRTCLACPPPRPARGDYRLGRGPQSEHGGWDSPSEQRGWGEGPVGGEWMNPLQKTAPQKTNFQSTSTMATPRSTEPAAMNNIIGIFFFS